MLKSNFEKWFPSYNKVNSHLLSTDNTYLPTFRLLCIPGAGSSDQVFIQKNLEGNSNSSNLLIEYCQKNEIELLVLQLPGRAGRSNEECYTDIITLMDSFFPIFIEHFIGNIHTAVRKEIVPWVLIGHSMGGLIAFELLKKLKYEFMKSYIQSYNMEKNIEKEKYRFVHALRENKVFPELLLIMSTFPPNVSINECPWRRSKYLNNEEFKQECKEWGINENVFKEGIWEIFEKQLRCDFQIFDSYELIQIDKLNYSSNQQLLDCLYPLGIKKVQFWSATKDHKVTKEKMRAWTKILLDKGDSPEFYEIDASHNFLHNQVSRKEWTESLITSLDLLILDLEYS